MFKSGVRTDAEGSAEKTEDRTGRSQAMSQIPRKDTGVGRDHGSKKTITKKSVPMQGRDGTAPHMPLSENLYEKGNIQKCVGKIRGTEASLGSQDKVQIINQVKPLIGMQWETTHIQEVDKV